jgi:hypothetical protein
MRHLAILLCALLLAGPAAALAGCGSDTKVVTDNGKARTVPDVKFAKTKFVIDAGLAFGAFKRYIYDPYKAGKFKKGAQGRKTAFIKAAAAGLFAYNRLKAAHRAALSSDTLRKLADKVDAAAGKLKGLATGLKGGNLNPGAILGIGGGIAGITGAAKSLGVNVKNRDAGSLIPGL